MKHVKETAAILVLVLAGVAFSQQAQDGSKKPATRGGAKKSECCSGMKTKAGGKTDCCAADTAAAKDRKSCCGNH